MEGRYDSMKQQLLRRGGDTRRLNDDVNRQERRGKRAHSGNKNGYCSELVVLSMYSAAFQCSVRINSNITVQLV